MNTDILLAFQGFIPSSYLNYDLRLLFHCEKKNRCPKELMQYIEKPEHTRFLIKVTQHYVNTFDRPQCLKMCFFLSL